MTPNEALFEELNARLEAVEAQRTRALTDHAVAHGKLSVVTKANAGLSEKLNQADRTIAELRAKVAKLEADAPPQVQEA